MGNSSSKHPSPKSQGEGPEHSRAPPKQTERQKPAVRKKPPTTTEVLEAANKSATSLELEVKSLEDTAVGAIPRSKKLRIDELITREMVALDALEVVDEERVQRKAIYKQLDAIGSRFEALCSERTVFDDLTSPSKPDAEAAEAQTSSENDKVEQIQNDA